jgi:hypothetical protein
MKPAPSKIVLRARRRIVRALYWMAALFAVSGCAFLHDNFSDDGMPATCNTQTCPASAGMQCVGATCDRLDGLKYHRPDAGIDASN